MEEPTPGTCGVIKSEVSEFFTDEWYVAVDGMEAVVNGEANAHRVAASPEMEAVLEWIAQMQSLNDLGDIMPRLNAALAKAKGEAA